MKNFNFVLKNDNMKKMADSQENGSHQTEETEKIYIGQQS